MNDNFMRQSQKMKGENITPLKTNLMMNNEFLSGQRGKYDIPSKSMQSIVSNSNYQTENYNNQKEIYENQIPLLIKSSEREDFSNFLNLKISFINSPKGYGQILHLELTDEANNLFLYTLNLSESDFLSLKNEQSLLVDFQNFPAKLIELLELCISNNAVKEEKVNFSCVFEIKLNGDSNLLILETNPFKSLIHLTLKFRSSTDETLKTFLSSKLNGFKQENEDLRIKNQRLEESLNSKIFDYAKLEEEMRRTKEEGGRREERRDEEDRRKESERRMQWVEKEEIMRKEWEGERKSLKEREERIVGELERKVASLIKNNEELNELRLKYESRERELSTKVSLLMKENGIYQKDLESIRLDMKSLESNKFSQEKLITELQIKLESSEKHTFSKEELVQKSKELLDNAYRQRDSLELSLAEVKKSLEKMEAKCTKCAEEINRGNEIIQKLQDELIKKKEKIKIKNSLVIQQEQTICQLSENLEKMNRTSYQNQMDVDNKEVKIKELETQVSEFKEKLLEGQKIIESNNSMIQYLNRCLNEQQKGGIGKSFSNINKYCGVTGLGQSMMENENRNTLNYPPTLSVQEDFKYKTLPLAPKPYSKYDNFHDTSKSPMRIPIENEEKMSFDRSSSKLINTYKDYKEKSPLEYSDLGGKASNLIKPIKYKKDSSK